MTEHRHFNRMAAFIMAFAVILAVSVWIFPELFGFAAPVKDRTPYEEAVFNKDRMVRIDISADESAFKSMLENARQEYYNPV